jgi:ADP-heptose:LPS heptosyltransferase
MATDLTNLLRQNTGVEAAVRWQVNNCLTSLPWLLNQLGARLTVFDVFGGLGDTLLTAIVCRYLKLKYPRIRLNILTPNPELVQHDLNVDEINEPESYVCLWVWYLDHIEQKDGGSHVLKRTFERLHIRVEDYRARVYLSEQEIDEGRSRVGPTARPLLAFNTLSKEPVKNWPVALWLELIEKLSGRFELVHLGDDKEPVFPCARRFAGRLSLRQSMAVLSQARCYVGPDSFLMHAANGLDVPCVIIFGGSRTPKNVGYRQNINLFVKMPCGPCWIHENRGERCEHDLECLRRISVSEVYDAIMRLHLPGSPRNESEQPSQVGSGN